MSSTPDKIPEEEKQGIRKGIDLYKKYERLVHNGLYYRLSDAGTDRYTAWEFASEDGTEALVLMVVPENHGNAPTIYVTPRGLTSGAEYKDEETGTVYSADALMDAGFPTPVVDDDRESFMFHLVRL